jgi:hypothetical protein
LDPQARQGEIYYATIGVRILMGICLTSGILLRHKNIRIANGRQLLKSCLRMSDKRLACLGVTRLFSSLPNSQIRRINTRFYSIVHLLGHWHGFEMPRLAQIHVPEESCHQRGAHMELKLQLEGSRSTHHREYIITERTKLESGICNGGDSQPQ